MKIVFFSGKGESSDAVYAYLKNKHDLVGVVIDGPSSRKKLIKRRIKKLGYSTVFLQLVFMKGIVPLLKIESKKRRIELLNSISLENVKTASNLCLPSTINSEEVIDFVKKSDPDLIVVNGTRIISKKIIEAVKTPMINMHVGITPKYRGVHGGYWALVNKDKEHCGVTVHLIDSGIDTGGVLVQKNIGVSKKDNFITYPLLQLKQGIICLEEAINQVKNNKIKIVKNNLPSKLYYHPTITTYLYHRIFRGVK